MHQNHYLPGHSLSQLFEHRELLLVWTLRQIRSRYRQSVLGFGWAFVQPVVAMVVISVIFGGFLRVPSNGVPYPVFSYVAILPWTLFSGSIGAAVPSVLVNMDLVTKTYFPREILPLAAILTRFVDFGIASLVFGGLILWYHIPVQTTWLYVPVLLLVQTLLAIGIGFFGSAISVFLRDFSFAVPLAMQVWMYLTPVIYPLSMVPERFRSLYMLNPMAGIITGYRQVVLEGTPPDWRYLGYSTLISVGLAIVGYLYFKRIEMSMADII